MQEEYLIRVEAPKFVAGFVVRQDCSIVACAPILKRQFKYTWWPILLEQWRKKKWSIEYYGDD